MRSTGSALTFHAAMRSASSSRFLAMHLTHVSSKLWGSGCRFGLSQLKHGRGASTAGAPKPSDALDLLCISPITVIMWTCASACYARMNNWERGRSDPLSRQSGAATVEQQCKKCPAVYKLSAQGTTAAGELSCGINCSYTQAANSDTHSAPCMQAPRRCRSTQ